METNAPPSPPWAMLLQELLEIILLKLDLADHIRFSSICKRWRSIADANTTANKPLSLVRSADSVSVIYRLLKSLGNLQWHDARFVGGLKGWLVLRLSYQMILPELGSRKTKRQLFLLNPGSRLAPILLPDWDVGWWTRGSVHKVVLSSPPDECSADKCVIVCKDSYCNLAFCKLGDTKWTKIWRDDIRDIVFYNEQLYAIDSGSVLRVFDYGLDSDPTFCFLFPRCLESYMLVSSNKLLLIQIENGDSVPCLIKAFEIETGTRSSYIEMESLGDDTILFLSRSCSLCLPAEENPEFIPNRVYKLYKLISDNDQRSFCSGSLDEERMVEINTEKSPLFFTLFRNIGFKNLDVWK